MWVHGMGTCYAGSERRTAILESLVLDPQVVAILIAIFDGALACCSCGGATASSRFLRAAPSRHTRSVNTKPTAVIRNAQSRAPRGSPLQLRSSS